jgi:hypothetical protein
VVNCGACGVSLTVTVTAVRVADEQPVSLTAST